MLYRLASRLREHEEALRRASEIAAGAMNPIRPAQSMASGRHARLRQPSGSDVAAPAAPTEPTRATESRRRHTAADRGDEAGPTHPRRHRRRVRAESTNVVGRFDRATGFTPEVDLSYARHQAHAQPPPCASITRDADGWHLSEPKPTGKRDVRQRRARQRGREDQTVGRRSVAFSGWWKRSSAKPDGRGSAPSDS